MILFIGEILSATLSNTHLSPLTIRNRESKNNIKGSRLVYSDNKNQCLFNLFVSLFFIISSFGIFFLGLEELLLVGQFLISLIVTVMIGI